MAGMQLEKNGQFFQVPHAYFEEIAMGRFYLFHIFLSGALTAISRQRFETVLANIQQNLHDSAILSVLWPQSLELARVGSKSHFSLL